jgi:hypothetical protein
LLRKPLDEWLRVAEPHTTPAICHLTSAQDCGVILLSRERQPGLKSSDHRLIALALKVRAFSCSQDTVPGSQPKHRMALFRSVNSRAVTFSKLAPRLGARRLSLTPCEQSYAHR